MFGQDIKFDPNLVNQANFSEFARVVGQAIFATPVQPARASGLLGFDAGWSADLTPKLHANVNVNLLRFQHTDVLSALLFQQNIDRAIGVDTSAGVQYRPWLNDNIIVTAGASVFSPAAGFRNILTPQTLVAPFIVLTLRY